LPALLETNIYRIVQECLNNCARHAHATCVSIELGHIDQTIVCRIKDNGVGFDVAETLNRRGSSCLGLMGIRERAESLGGTVSLKSAPGAGTELTVRLPLAIEAPPTASGSTEVPW
jgi:signal transduction histidine kinase